MVVVMVASVAGGTLKDKNRIDDDDVVVVWHVSTVPSTVRVIN